VKKIGLVRAAQQPVQDVASDISLANYFLRYAFYVVMVSIDLLQVGWDSQVRSVLQFSISSIPFRPYGSPSQTPPIADSMSQVSFTSKL
jgi:hypothetical protein